jgi:hypothetical protein
MLDRESEFNIRYIHAEVDHLRVKDQVDNYIKNNDRDGLVEFI